MDGQADVAVRHGRKPSAVLRWLIMGLMVAIVAVVGLFAWGLGRDATFIPSPLVEREAPALDYTLFSGERFSLAEHRGHPVVVNFWASWCTACKEEAPVLEAGWRTFRDEGLVFTGVNIQDKREDALAFIRSHGKTYPNGPDPEGKITIDFGVYAVPETFFIDRTGRIAHKHFGPLTWEVLSKQIREIL